MSGKKNRFGSLSSIARGASFYLVGKVILNILGFLFHLVLSRSLGAGTYGVYAYGNTILNILLIFTNLGSDKSILKYLPQYEDDPVMQRFILGLAVTTSLIGSVTTGFVIFIFASKISNLTIDMVLFENTLRIFAILLVLDTISKVLHSVFRGVEMMAYEVISNKILNPLFNLVAIVIMLGIGASLVGIVAGLAIASLLTVFVAIYILLTQVKIRPSICTEKATKKNIYMYYNFSVPLTLQGAGSILTRRVDVLMVGFFFSSSVVGVYNISLLITGFLVLPLIAFNQLFPPVASRLYSNNEIEELNWLYSTVTRWVFTISLIMGIGTVVYRQEILILFGEDFTTGTWILILFTIGQLFNSTGGPSGYILMVTGHQYPLVLTQWSIGLMNVVLNYIFILEHGAVGAALATASTLSILNIVRVVEVWYFEGLFPYSTDYFKPIFAGAIAAIVTYLIGFILSGILLMIVGGILGLISYIGALYLLGIEQDDKKFFRKVVLNKF